jgi:hypothetical protein
MAVAEERKRGDRCISEREEREEREGRESVKQTEREANGTDAQTD